MPTVGRFEGRCAVHVFTGHHPPVSLENKCQCPVAMSCPAEHTLKAKSAEAFTTVQPFTLQRWMGELPNLIGGGAQPIGPGVTYMR